MELKKHVLNFYYVSGRVSGPGDSKIIVQLQSLIGRGESDIANTQSCMYEEQRCTNPDVVSHFLDIRARWPGANSSVNTTPIAAVLDTSLHLPERISSFLIPRCDIHSSPEKKELSLIGTSASRRTLPSSFFSLCFLLPADARPLLFSLPSGGRGLPFGSGEGPFENTCHGYTPAARPVPARPCASPS